MLDYEFTVFVAPLTWEKMDALCGVADDLEGGISNGVSLIEARREAESLPEAVASVLRDLARAGIRALRIDLQAEDLDSSLAASASL